MALNSQCRLALTPAIGATELHVDLYPTARALFLVPLRALGAALAALAGPQPAEAQPAVDPAHS